ncbi:profilin-2 [Lactuca sativa]|uniref:Profilin n=1 Tax=Lactuca sativa TaxID=4236 RepID=A0A9R1V0C8_LACSA|nr:profilin-2 [Lactuca sativa]KAJ0196053.1 hypothetical protein LSAT_V11C700358420 [Lactuca sativa]
MEAVDGEKTARPHHHTTPSPSSFLFTSLYLTPISIFQSRNLNQTNVIVVKMSWQTYVDDHLMCDIDGSGQHLSSAAITGLDGTVWAQSAKFPQFKPEEMKAICNEFDNAGTLAPTGLFLGGAKYMVLQGEAGAVIRGKKGAGGICIKKTGQAMVFGLYDEPVNPGQCNMVVERLGDYLVDQGM